MYMYYMHTHVVVTRCSIQNAHFLVLRYVSLYECQNTNDYQLVITVVMKNCEPLVSGPAFAIDRNPALKRETKRTNYTRIPVLKRSPQTLRGSDK